MKRVLVISDEFQQSDRSPRSFQFDSTTHVIELDLRPINGRRLLKRLRALGQIDLIILQENSIPSAQSTAPDLLFMLETTGIPVMMLPSSAAGIHAPTEPRLLNWPVQDGLSHDLLNLLKHIRTQNGAAKAAGLGDIQGNFSSVMTSAETQNAVALPPSQKATSSRYSQTEQPFSDGKAAQTLMAIRRISGQLREPLSNMNLAIHMLGRAQSAVDQQRYLKLLREEYNRELQLLNQLDSHLQADLPSLAYPTDG